MLRELVFDPLRGSQHTYDAIGLEDLKEPFELYTLPSFFDRFPVTVALLKCFDGVSREYFADRVELDEHGELVRLLTYFFACIGYGSAFERDLDRYSHREIIRIPKNAKVKPDDLFAWSQEQTVGMWTLKTGREDTEGYEAPHRPFVQRRINAIIERTQQEWQEWKASESQLDFRAWIGDKRVAALKAQGYIIKSSASLGDMSS